MKSFLNYVMERFVPQTEIRRKNRCLWMNYECRKTIKMRNRFWKKYIVSEQYADYMK